MPQLGRLRAKASTACFSSDSASYGETGGDGSAGRSPAHASSLSQR